MKQSIGILVCLIVVTLSCSLFESKEDNSSKNAIAATLLLSRSTTKTASATSGVCNGVNTSTGSTISNSTATLDAGTGCVTGVSSCMDSALPSWIKDNFKCAVGFVSGTNYKILSKNLPNTKSAYYGTTSPLYEAITIPGNSANPSLIGSQTMEYTIPMTPSKGTGTTSTQGGLVSIGITTNGLAIYNNAAAPGDVLASETKGFDNYSGHPESSSIYHHHAAVPKVCDNTTLASNSTSCNNSTLIGIALDGFAIYGQKCDNGTAATGDDFTPGDLDSLHGHTKITTHFTTATYHYHYAYDSTATIYTLIGSFFYGNIGSVSN